MEGHSFNNGGGSSCGYSSHNGNGHSRNVTVEEKPYNNGGVVDENPNNNVGVTVVVQTSNGGVKTNGNCNEISASKVLGITNGGIDQIQVTIV